MHLDDLRAFLAVADSGSFTSAALEMTTAKSVVSRRVTRLEKFLGTSLFVRSSKGVTTTDTGTALRKRAADAFSELNDALLDAAQRSGELTGLLRITAPIALGNAHLADFIADFMRRHPKLRLDASFTNRKADILADGYDVAVRMGALKDSILVARRIAPMRICIVASPDYILKCGAPTSPRDLAQHECIIYGIPGGDIWRFQSASRVNSVRVAGRIRSDNANTNMASAIAGLGIAAMPKFIVGDAIRRGSLIPLLTGFPVIEQGIFAVRQPGPANANTRAFIDALAKRFEEEPDWEYLE